MKNIAIILSGCGVYDGSEIHEAVLTLLAIRRQGATYQCFAPDRMQHHVIDHVKGVEMNEERNVLTESARIARGNILPLAGFSARNYDALVFPGGFGAAKNLCDWALRGENCEVDPDVEQAVMAMAAAGKPIGAMCIAPVILAKLFSGVRLTTGQDPASAGFIRHCGNTAVATQHGEVTEDARYRLFTTPCYMLDASIVEIEAGTSNLIRAILASLD